MQCHLWSQGRAVRGRVGFDGEYRGAGCASLPRPVPDRRTVGVPGPDREPHRTRPPRAHAMVTAPPTETCTTLPLRRRVHRAALPRAVPAAPRSSRRARDRGDDRLAPAPRLLRERSGGDAAGRPPRERAPLRRLPHPRGGDGGRPDALQDGGGDRDHVPGLSRHLRRALDHDHGARQSPAPPLRQGRRERLDEEQGHRRRAPHQAGGGRRDGRPPRLQRGREGGP